MPEDEMQDELLNALRRLNPVSRDDVAGAGQSLRAQMLLDSIVSGERKAPVPWWRRRRFVVPVVIGLALATAAAGYAIAGRSASRATFVRCYEQPMTSASFVLAPQGGSVDDATAQCASLWKIGSFGTPSNPPLASCVLGTGQLAVFPGDSESLCGRLGLAVALPTPPSVRAVATLYQFLANHVSLQSCLSLPDAQTVTQQELATLGLSGWTVKVTASTPSTTTANCASTEIDQNDQIVYILPVPPSG